MSDSTEIVGYSTEQEVTDLVNAVELLKRYSLEDLPSLAEFRHAAAALTSNLLLKTLQGDYGEPRNMKEAIQIANMVVDLVVKRDMAAVGDDIAQISDPAERHAVFQEIKEKAAAAVRNQKT